MNTPCNQGVNSGECSSGASVRCGTGVAIDTGHFFGGGSPIKMSIERILGVSNKDFGCNLGK